MQSIIARASDGFAIHGLGIFYIHLVYLYGKRRRQIWLTEVTPGSGSYPNATLQVAKEISL